MKKRLTNAQIEKNVQMLLKSMSPPSGMFADNGSSYLIARPYTQADYDRTVQHANIKPAIPKQSVRLNGGKSK